MHASADVPRLALRFLEKASRAFPALLKPALMLAAACALPIAQPRAQEALQMSADQRLSEPSADSMALAELGLDLAAIERCHDVERLWQAVRELVLPGRIAEAAQQRILRRVWAIDPHIRKGSFVESIVN